MTTKINSANVMLESVGTVEVSEIFVPMSSVNGAATGRPSPGYYEVAVLWGTVGHHDLQHCWIVDSNLTERGPADRLFEQLCDERQLADLMLHVVRNPNQWDA
jgi:hypothetical protein